MKNFVKENWYKLMIGSSMMMASFGFMIYAISPAYSNSDKDKTEFKNPENSNIPIGTYGYANGPYVYFVDGGYVYRYEPGLDGAWKGTDKTNEKSTWQKSKLP